MGVGALRQARDTQALQAWTPHWQTLFLSENQVAQDLGNCSYGSSFQTRHQKWVLVPAWTL